MQIQMHELPAIIIAGILGAYHGYLIAKTGGSSSAYYVGIALATVGYSVFLPWQPKMLVIALILHYLPYGAVILFGSNTIVWAALIPSLSFLFALQGIASFSFFHNRKLRIRELEAQLALENDNLKKERIIEERTQQRAHLEKLTGQFSPQVVSLIQSGELDVEKKIRRQISIVFIDVENSTNRSVKIDYTKYTAMLSDFFTDCVDIFLAHDVTIGSYLGDGMMAFANAPHDQIDHEARVFSACVKILEMHRKKRNYYLEHWRAEFNIKIGIESGWGMCGFFPSLKRGTYSAIGDTTNLTARLCSLAPSNEICVTKSFLKTIHDKVSELEIKPIKKTTDIKGFEGEYFELFSIKLPKGEPLAEQADRKCVLCDGILKVESEHTDSLFVKCQSCGYVDLISTLSGQNLKAS